MVECGADDGVARTRTSSDLQPGPRKFTLSCSRCRASKLKCDQKEPCIECVKRNVAHLCTKDERQPRVKRAKTNNHGSKANPKGNLQTYKRTDAEEAVEALERFVDETSSTNVYSSTGRDAITSSISPDYVNSFWSITHNQQRGSERLQLIRQIIDAMPGKDIIQQLYEVFTTRCQGPLGNVVHTPSFMNQAEELLACLDLDQPQSQVEALSRAFSMEDLACHLLALVLALAFHPTPSVHGWSPTPVTLRLEELRASGLHSKMWRSLVLRCLQGEATLFCGSIAALQAAVMLMLHGQGESLSLDAILVTAISGAQRLGLHRLGDRALEVSIPPFSSPEINLCSAMLPPHIRTEIGIRIWWALVMRDWSRSQALGYYSIRPSQFNTRMPLHVNDEDLCTTTPKVDERNHVVERPRSEFTMLSYTVHAMEIAVFARESVDLYDSLSRAREQEEKKKKEGAKMRDHLNKRYQKFVEGLPSHFRLGSSMGLTSAGTMAAIPVHRWMLHQQLWSLFLRLHRASISSRNGASSCQLLAQNIISTQAHIQARCAVCGSLSSSKNQVFSAAVALLIDSLFTSKTQDIDGSSAQLGQILTREKIREAIELLRSQRDTADSPAPKPNHSERRGTAARSIIVLEALLKLEEEESGYIEDDTKEYPKDTLAKAQRSNWDDNRNSLLKTKVVNVLKAIQGNERNVDEETEPAGSNLFSAADAPLSSTNDRVQDFNVLPVLSNNPGYNWWQYLDFSMPENSTDNGAFSDPTIYQSSIDPFTLRALSPAAHSFDHSGAPELTEMYTNINGTHSIPMSSLDRPTIISGRHTFTTPFTNHAQEQQDNTAMYDWT